MSTVFTYFYTHSYTRISCLSILSQLLSVWASDCFSPQRALPSLPSHTRD
jgi:hypothetical protein